MVKRCPHKVAIALLLGLAAPVFGLGRAPNGDFGLPEPVRAATVRVTGSHVEGPANDPERVTQRGSGVVIATKPDTTGGGGWAVVLTADHVAGQQLENPAGQNWRDPSWQVGFGNGTLAGGPWIPVNAAQVFRGPLNGQNRVDLTVLGVHLDNIGSVSAVPFIQGRASTSLAQAGYGDDVTANAQLVNKSRNYLITGPNDQGQRYGTYRDGINQVDQIIQVSQAVGAPIPIGVVNYDYSALQSHLAFLPGDGKLPITFGASYFLTGDSGGPSFQRDSNSNWRVVGIHSASQTQDATGTGDGYAIVLENSVQFDVNLWAYQNFVNNAVQAVPEPASVALLVLGGALVSARRRAGRGGSRCSR